MSLTGWPHTLNFNIMSAVEALLDRLLQPPRLLYVEDDTQVANLFIDRLSRDYVCDIVWVRTAEEAFAAIKNGKYDIMFVDLVLPNGPSGVEVIKRAKEEMPGLPIVITSGYLHTDLADQAANYGIVSFISKPFQYSDFTDIFAAYKIRARTKENDAYFASKRRSDSVRVPSFA